MSRVKVRVVLVAFALVASSGVLAGCLGDAGEAAKKPSSPVKKAGATPRPVSPAPEPQDPDEVNRTLGQRWHFHNYWGLNPNLTLLDAEVGLEAGVPSVSAPPARAVVGQATFGLPYGRIVPPETGTLTVTLHYNASPALGPLNLSFKPANVGEFIPAGSASAGESVVVPVTADMTDVPHRGRSVWQFRLAAAPNAQGVGVANGTVHVVVVATIGRPIFIDPPHIDHWGGADTVPVVSGEADVSAARAPVAGNAYVAADASSGPRQAAALAEFPVVNGSVVPEGARVVLARLAWESEVPPQVATLALEYAEENFGTSDRPAPVSDKPGERLYRIPLLPRQTDSPYANQSTWTFRVLLGGDAGAFAGKVRLDVWASRFAVDAAEFPAAASAGGEARSAARPGDAAAVPVSVAVPSALTY